MEAQEGGGVTFRIVLVEREAVIVRDLPPQGFAGRREVGILTHTARYEPWPNSRASSLPHRSRRQGVAGIPVV